MRPTNPPYQPTVSLQSTFPRILSLSRIYRVHHTTIQLGVRNEGLESHREQAWEGKRSPSVHPYITRGCVSQRIVYPVEPSRIQFSTTCKLTVRVGTGCICAYGPFRVARTAKPWVNPPVGAGPFSWYDPNGTPLRAQADDFTFHGPRLNCKAPIIHFCRGLHQAPLDRLPPTKQSSPSGPLVPICRGCRSSVSSCVVGLRWLAYYCTDRP